MAKNNNLTDFLTNLANKFRSVLGISNTLNPQDFEDLITSTYNKGYNDKPSVAEEKDVNFIDYEGTILYSYTLTEVQALTELPELPSHNGLICQGWNWTLAEIKEYADKLEVGANYTTSDGKTRIYIDVPSNEFALKYIEINFAQTVANGVEIDWGDGSTIETMSGSGTSTIIAAKHTYSEGGEYLVTLNCISGTMSLGANSTGKSITGSNAQSFSKWINKVYVGNNVTGLSNGTFTYNYNLTEISIPNTVTSFGSTLFQSTGIEGFVFPKGITSIGSTMFQHSNRLKYVSLPSTVTSLNTYVFSYCRNLRRIAIPKNVGNIGNYCFRDIYSLSEIKIPDKVTLLNTYFLGNNYSLKKVKLPANLSTLNNYCFSNCYSLQDINLPSPLKTIGQNCFAYCYNLSAIVFPASLTTIMSNAFTSCNSMIKYDFTACTSIPTLANTNGLKLNSSTKIVVPDDLYDSWIAATNWSTYSSYIVKESEYSA